MARKLGDVLHFFLDAPAAGGSTEASRTDAGPAGLPAGPARVSVAIGPDEALRGALTQLIAARAGIAWCGVDPDEGALPVAGRILHFVTPDPLDLAALARRLPAAADAHHGVIAHQAASPSAARAAFEASAAYRPDRSGDGPTWLGTLLDDRALLAAALLGAAPAPGAARDALEVVVAAVQEWLAQSNEG